MDDHALGEKVEIFFKYVLDTYFETNIFPVKFWNHFATNTEITNNFVEGDNLKMKKFFDATN